MSMIRIEGLTKTFRDGDHTHEVLAGLDLEVEAGEFVALLGRSGSGKSTLLNCLAGIDTFDGGTVEIDGVEISSLDETRRTRLRRDRIGIVFQFFHLLPTLDVWRNVALPALLRGDPRGEVDERVRALLEELDVAEKADVMPDRLSGGQQQRVAIARALINDPAVLLADEPTGNLDTDTAGRTLELFRRVHEQHGVTIVMVTHAREAATVAGRVARLVEGRLQAVELSDVEGAAPTPAGTPEEAETPSAPTKPPPPGKAERKGSVRPSARAAALFAAQEEEEQLSDEERARREADQALAEAEEETKPGDAPSPPEGEDDGTPPSREG